MFNFNKDFLFKIILRESKKIFFHKYLPTLHFFHCEVHTPLQGILSYSIGESPTL